MKRILLYLLLALLPMVCVESEAATPKTPQKSTRVVAKQKKAQKKNNTKKQNKQKQQKHRKRPQPQKAQHPLQQPAQPSQQPSQTTVTDTVVASIPSSVEENDTLRLTTYDDTVRTVLCRYEQIAVAQPEEQDTVVRTVHSLKGHQFQAWLGAGYGTLGYQLTAPTGEAAGTEHGSGAGQIQLNYAYYFTDNWGIAVGAGFSHYHSYGTLNHSKQWSGQTDSDGERYTHIATAQNWQERQALYMVDIPVMVQMQYPVAPKLRVYAAAGAKIGIPVVANRQLRSGAVEHAGQYDRWNLLMTGVDNHDFYTETAASFGTEQHPLSLQIPAAGVAAEVGVAWPLNDQLDLIGGLFANYTCNSVRSATASGDIGWRRTDQTGELAYRNHDFMPEYEGLLASEYVHHVHPWAVGLKVGIAWKHHPQPAPKPIQYEQVQTCDTTLSLSRRIERFDKPRPVAVQQIVRLMDKAVIWFDLDSTDPKLEPADILERIAAILIAHPEQRIQVFGHASREGNEAHNQRLSNLRAKAIADRLIDLGVNPEQITQRGFAATVSYQEGEHAISLDRRVEIIPIIDEQ